MTPPLVFCVSHVDVQPGGCKPLVKLLWANGLRTSRDARLERDILSSHSVQGQVASLKGKTSGMTSEDCFLTQTAIHARMFAHHQYVVHVRPLQVPSQGKPASSSENPDPVVLCALGVLI